MNAVVDAAASLQTPYLGLRPYQESEKDRFFGRDEEIHILTDKILANRLTLLVAASGVGKSSLLQAGVMPALRAGGMADLIYHNDWALDPLNGLKQAVVKHLIERRRIDKDYRPDAEQDLPQFLRIHSLLAEGMFVILLDQFEEFFYYQRFSRQRDRFVAQLAAAILDAEIPAAFVFSMREDFAMELNAFKSHLRSVFNSVYRIEKLKLSAARQAIERPVQAAGFTYQSELIDRLLHDLGSRERENRPEYENFDAPLRVEPPHLQIVCQALWEKAAEGAERCIGLPHYQALGDAKGVLDGYFQAKMRALSGEQQRLASRAFDHLVSQHGAKMAYPLPELAELLREDAQALQNTLDLLQAAAILRRVQRQEQPWYELYHDIFAQSINAWNRRYKERQLRKRLLWRGFFGLALAVAAWLAVDAYTNRHGRHLRLGKETVSERLETYRGAPDSSDVFGQQGFLFETDFERLDLEADKRSEQTVLSDLNHAREFEIGLLPLMQRFIGYAQYGLYSKAFGKVAKDLQNSRDDQLLTRLIEHVPKVRTKSVIHLLSYLLKGHAKNAELSKSVMAAVDELNAPSVLLLLGEELKGDKNPDVQWVTIKVLAQLQDLSVLPLLDAALKDENYEVRVAVIQALAQLQDLSVLPLLGTALKEDKHPYVRKMVVEVLSQMKGLSALPLLDEVLKEDTDSSVRKASIETLAQLQDPSVLPLLRAALKEDKDSSVRKAAIVAMAQLKDPSVLPLLNAALKDDEDDVVRDAAVEALAESQDPSALPLLRTALNDQKPYIRQLTIAALARLKDPSALSLLRTALKDRDAYVKKAAIEGLAQMKDSSALALLSTVLKEDEDYSARKATIEALAQLKDPSALPLLSAALKDQEPEVRKAAIAALSQLQEPSVLPLLRAALNEQEHYVRNEVIEALARLQDTSVLPLLDAALKDREFHVRKAAIDALAQIRNLSALPLLVAALKDQKPSVREIAIKAVARLKEPSALPLLGTALKEDKDSDVRKAAIAALAQLHDSSVLPLLGAALKEDKSPDVRRAAIAALAQMKDLSALPLLGAALSDDDDYSRAEAIYALASLQDPSALPWLGVALKDQALYVRQSAIAALAQLKSLFALPLLNTALNDRQTYMGHLLIEALAPLKARSALPLLRAALKKEAGERRAAIAALAQLQDPSALPLLRSALNDQDTSVRQAAIDAFGLLGVKGAVPDLWKALTGPDNESRQNAARALSRLRVETPALASWQTEQLAEQAEKLTSASSSKKVGIAEALGFVYHVKSVELLLGLLAEEDDDVVGKALTALGDIGAYHPEWLRPHLSRLLELGKPANPARQEAVFSAVGQILSFAGGAAETALGGDERRLRDYLAAVARDASQSAFLRAAAVDALGVCGRLPCVETLATLLKDPRQSDQHFRTAFWLAQLRYAPALPELKRQFAALVEENRNWREQRDRDAESVREGVETDANAVSTSADPAPKSWQKEAEVFQYAYAVAQIDPDGEGIALLNHPLHAARQAAVIALAGRADGKLVKKLVESHQAFDPDDLPSPFPYALYQALDKALYTVEYLGNADDLKLLQAIKGKRIETQLKTQEDAINERFDWTIFELEHRLKFAENKR